MRIVSAQDLEQLGKLLDGKGGVADRLTEAFSRARTLGVSHQLTPVQAMHAWVDQTAPDLRRRADISRRDDAFTRRHRETYSDWLIRIEAYYLAKAPGVNTFSEKDIGAFLRGAEEVGNFLKIGGAALLYSATTAKTLGGNSFSSGRLAALKNADWWRRGGTARGLAGQGLSRINPVIRPLAAPGSWLPGQLSNLANGSAAYRNATRIPFTAGLRGDLIGRGWDAIRGSQFMRNSAVNKFINAAVGSDELARIFGGRTHAGTRVIRAGQASLVQVFKNARNLQIAVNGASSAAEATSPFRAGLAAASKVSGGLRSFTIAGGVISTGVSIANVAAQGNPVEAFRKKGAGYVADVAEAGFNASLTAAMIAPNPVTIGFAIGTGAIYAGAKVVEHWPEIKEGAKAAGKWVGEKAAEFGEGLVDGAVNAGKALNPANWF